ncbi:hypothetical protein NDY24_22380 [Xanthomonas hortorum pv. pelargonii]|nr:hypothetical protein NDY24_22380 [Xanthomonas hortorum pv. pelargonii]
MDSRSEPMPVANTTAKFELGLTVGPAGDGLVGQLNYATALFNVRGAQRFATHFQDVLRAMTVTAGCHRGPGATAEKR